GTSSRSSDGAGGVESSTAATIRARFGPSNAGRPETISNNTAPKAKRSDAGSASLPSSSSGAMYATVPTSVPSAVNDAGSSIGSDGSPEVAGTRPVRQAFARPKSSNFAPPAVSMMLAGL